MPKVKACLGLVVSVGIIPMTSIWLTGQEKEKGIAYDIIYLSGVLGQKFPEGKDLGILHFIVRHEISRQEMRNLLPVVLFCSMSGSFISKKFLSWKTFISILQPSPCLLEFLDFVLSELEGLLH